MHLPCPAHRATSANAQSVPLSARASVVLNGQSPASSGPVAKSGKAEELQRRPMPGVANPARDRASTVQRTRRLDRVLALHRCRHRRLVCRVRDALLRITDRGRGPRRAHFRKHFDIETRASRNGRSWLRAYALSLILLASAACDNKQDAAGRAARQRRPLPSTASAPTTAATEARMLQRPPRRPAPFPKPERPIPYRRPRSGQACPSRSSRRPSRTWRRCASHPDDANADPTYAADLANKLKPIVLSLDNGGRQGTPQPQSESLRVAGRSISSWPLVVTTRRPRARSSSAPGIRSRSSSRRRARRALQRSRASISCRARVMPATCCARQRRVTNNSERGEDNFTAFSQAIIDASSKTVHARRSS